LLPTKNNVRVSEDPPEAQPDSLPPTPIYNNALLQDVALEFHHAIVQHQLASHRPLVDCLQLLKVWSHKRNLYCVGPSLFISGHAAEAARRPSFGCLNGFLLSMLLVHLLSIGKLTKHMTSYQLLRVVLTYLADAKADLYTKGIIMRPYTGTVADSNAIECASDEELQQSLAIWKLSFEIIFIDPSHRINLAASITRRHVHQSTCRPSFVGGLCRTNSARRTMTVLPRSCSMKQSARYSCCTRTSLRRCSLATKSCTTSMTASSA